jgi:hypothetical protein
MREDLRTPERSSVARRSRHSLFLTLVFTLLACLGMHSAAFAASPCPNEQAREERGAMALPECRAYEQVSPADSGSYETYFDGLSAETVFFASNGAIAGTPQGEDSILGTGRLFGASRSPGGWSTSSLTNVEGQSLQHNYVFLGASPDGSRVFYAQETTVFEEGGSADILGVLYETVDGGPPILISHNQDGLPEPLTRTAVEVSADGSHVVFSATAPLTAAAAEAGGGPYLYESDDAGNVSLVSAMSDGRLPSSPDGVSLGALGEASRVTNAVSVDGSTVFFTSEAPYDPGMPDGGAQIFMRRGEQTVDISRSQTGTPGTSGASFDGASGDGAEVVFSDPDQLTPDCPATGAEEIYEYATATGALSCLSRGDGGLVDGSSDSTFLAMSADGSRVFFASDEHLDQAGPPTNPANPTPSLYETVGGRVTYIATLSSADVSRLAQTTAPVGASGLQLGTAHLGPIRLTPDGTHLVFESDQALTPDYHGPERLNVYEYTEGRGLTRISQGSLAGSGGGPDEATIGSQQQLPEAAHGGPDPEKDLAPETFGASQLDGGVVSADGKIVFFSSREALTADAINGPLHVYEWDRGQTYLVSPPGPQATDTQYLESSADGADVYFSTLQAVLPSDTDGGRLDIYDARVDGGFHGVGAASACPGGECAVSEPPTRAVPLSSVFSGPGDPLPSISTPISPSTSKPKPLTRAQKLASALKACEHHTRKKRRAACERKARRQYAAKPQSEQAVRGRKR